MADLTQLPTTINIETSPADDFSMLIDVSISLTGYTFVAAIDAATSIAATVTNTDLANGQISVAWTKAQLTALGVGMYNWRLDWTVTAGSLTRRALAGSFILKYKE